MTRETLCRRIQSRNNSLKLRQAQFLLISAQSKLALKKRNPYLLIGIGLLAGIVTRVIGWQRIYRLASAGANLYPFMINKYESPDASKKDG